MGTVGGSKEKGLEMNGTRGPKRKPDDQVTDSALRARRSRDARRLRQVMGISNPPKYHKSRYDGALKTRLRNALVDPRFEDALKQMLREWERSNLGE